MDTTKLKIKGLNVIKAEDVYNMLVGAIEGGSNYWYLIDTEINQFVPELKGEPYVDKLITAIQKGHPVKVIDVENEDYLGTLTADSWAKAEKLMIEKHPKHFADIVGENDDATTADVFFQLAVMGELIYG